MNSTNVSVSGYYFRYSDNNAVVPGLRNLEHRDVNLILASQWTQSLLFQNVVTLDISAQESLGRHHASTKRSNDNPSNYLQMWKAKGYRITSTFGGHQKASWRTSQVPSRYLVVGWYTMVHCIDYVGSIVRKMVVFLAVSFVTGRTEKYCGASFFDKACLLYASKGLCIF